MFQGADQVGNAVQLLLARNAMLDERLYEAANEFLAALDDGDRWPVNLLEDALAIKERLTARGDLDRTIAGMDVAEAEDIAEDMLEIFVAIEVARAGAGVCRTA